VGCGGEGWVANGRMRPMSSMTIPKRRQATPTPAQSFRMQTFAKKPDTTSSQCVIPPMPAMMRMIPAMAPTAPCA
jgi:hypothetical protein